MLRRLHRGGAVRRVSVIVDNKPGGSGTIGSGAGRSCCARRLYPALRHVGHAHHRRVTHLQVALRRAARLPAGHQRRLRDLGDRRQRRAPRAQPRRADRLGTRPPASSTTLHRESSSANHLDTEVFASSADLRLTHVPYRGSTDGYRALLADDGQLMFGAITSALPYVRAGRLRALAVLSDRNARLSCRKFRLSPRQGSTASTCASGWGWWLRQGPLR